MEIIQWIENWFESHCDGDWEHENQIQMYTTSNPGWSVEIDLIYTKLENYTFEIDTVEKSDNDWYFFRFVNGKFDAAGDLSKLEFLLNKFKETVEKHAI